MPVPVLCGHEGAVIESVGEGVASVRLGDRVIPIWRSLVRAVRIWNVGSWRVHRSPTAARFRLEAQIPAGSQTAARISVRDFVLGSV